MAKKLNRRQTQLLKQYKRELSRIRSYIYRQRKKLGRVDISIKPLNKNPNSKDIKRLKNITLDKLRSKTYYTDFNTGLMNVPYSDIDFKEYNNQVKEANNYIIIADKVIESFKELLNTYPPKLKNISYKWLYEMLSKFDKITISEMLEEGRLRGNWVEIEVLTSDTEELLLYNLGQMLSYIKDTVNFDSNKIITDLYNKVYREEY